MRMLHRRVAALIAAGGLLFVVGEAHAVGASCDELLAARSRGESDAQIKAAYQTTHARLTACERITDKHQQLQARRDRFENAHAARAWLHSN